MSYSIRKVDVWVGDVLNRPGMLARVLEHLSTAGAHLEFLIARRVSERTSRVFVAPVKGLKQQRAADDVGLVRAERMFALRVEGRDRPGLGADLTRAVAAEGINLRGVSGAAIGRQVLFYFAFESPEGVGAAARIVRRTLTRGSRR